MRIRWKSRRTPLVISRSTPHVFTKAHTQLVLSTDDPTCVYYSTYTASVINRRPHMCLLQHIHSKCYQQTTPHVFTTAQTQQVLSADDPTCVSYSCTGHTLTAAHDQCSGSQRLRSLTAAHDQCSGSQRLRSLTAAHDQCSGSQRLRSLPAHDQCMRQWIYMQMSRTSIDWLMRPSNYWLTTQLGRKLTHRCDKWHMLDLIYGRLGIVV